jgi:hypothetical protein
MRARIRLFAPTVLRRLPNDPHVYLMNRQRLGFGERSIQLPNVAAVEAAYAVKVGEWTQDEHGDYAPVTLATEPGFARCPECGNLSMNPLPSCPTCGVPPDEHPAVL